MPASTRVLAAARSILAEQRSVCSSFVKSSDLRKVFTHTSTTARGSIGAHFRHSVDHFKAWHVAAKSVASGENLPRVYYEKRERDIAMEKDPDVAVKVRKCDLGYICGCDCDCVRDACGQELDELLNGLDVLGTSFKDIRGLPMLPLFRVPSGGGQLDGDVEEDVEFRSTVERELWFVSHHALHHNAMVYTIAAECSSEACHVLPDTFGMAPATVDFMQHTSKG